MPTILREGGMPSFMQKKSEKGSKGEKGMKGGLKKGGKGKEKAC